MEMWRTAQQNVHIEEQSYDPTTYQAYLQWYTPRTSIRCLRLLAGEQAEAWVTDTCPTHADSARYEVADWYGRCVHEQGTTRTFRWYTLGRSIITRGWSVHEPATSTYGTARRFPTEGGPTFAGSRHAPQFEEDFAHTDVEESDR
ncbi:hypothetical protein E2562_037805 [Oryza meyeriana var. granulata]|uniref:Uncharacterized protein n=1 Tax=Oryza meyeriana var. granulata TaxID=110450 RepID=A0A6G1DST0_9ORYZ|nr:hypothetical protein E2562_037805 [Oryza meyeriana var. granulata]